MLILAPSAHLFSIEQAAFAPLRRATERLDPPRVDLRILLNWTRGISHRFFPDDQVNSVPHRLFLLRIELGRGVAAQDRQEPAAARSEEHGYVRETRGRFFLVRQWRLDQASGNTA